MKDLASIYDGRLYGDRSQQNRPKMPSFIIESPYDRDEDEDD